MDKARKAIVLGARLGSDNIGEVIAKHLQSLNWDLYTSDCRGNSGGYTVPDLGDHGDADSLVVTLGKEHVLPFGNSPPDDLAAVVHANLTLPLLAAREFVRVRGNDGGKVAVIGSYAYDHPITNGVPYCAAKAGLHQATKTLGWELSPKGWAFHIVHPYHVPAAPMWDRVQEQVMATRDWTRQQADEYALQNLRQPEHLKQADIAEVVVWLLEYPVTDWLSGQGLELYGGTR